MKIEELLEIYEERKDEIKERILEFKGMMKKSEKRIFAELAFCICTPQTKAIDAWNAVNELVKNGLLYNGNSRKISSFLRKVRFGKKKAEYIVYARNTFTKNGKIRIKKIISSFKNPKELREWLVENVLGIGMKEASHFIRNLGLSENQIAILDVHILKNLQELKIVREFKPLSKRKYVEIENKMKGFSEKIGIPLDELDLLLWSKETGFVFR
ncbi:MAG: N-glycosylase/DNA lyase [Candidatus Aenigmatarchaeota archaeon]